MTKHLLVVKDLSPAEIESLFETAAKLKRERKQLNVLAGKTLALLFQKPSLRTRVSFEVGMAQLGGRSLYVGPLELQQGKREGAKDLAKVLSRYLDGIVARTFAHQEVVDLAAASSVPVINGLSDFAHPCQALADLFTVREKLKKLRGVRIAYVGDGNNVCHSLMGASALTGVQLSIATPPAYKPDAKLTGWAKQEAAKRGGAVELTDDPAAAVKEARIVYTDVWTSMGQETEHARRNRDFDGFQINAALLKKAARGALFMHCLPAHRGEEVSDEVMDSRNSIVYDQAENRLHVQKAILLMLLGKRKP